MNVGTWRNVVLARLGFINLMQKTPTENLVAEKMLNKNFQEVKNLGFLGEISFFIGANKCSLIFGSEEGNLK